MSTHEGMHLVGDAPHWSESYYFNFYDPKAQVGMFTRMGWRPGSGWADALHVVFLPGSQVAFTYGRRDIAGDLRQYDGDLNVGNLALRCIVPHERWLLDYNGEAQDIADGEILLQRSKLRPKGWFTPAHLDMSLEFECLSSPHFIIKDDFGHFEQSGKVSGTVKLGNEEWSVEGLGVRDKSWGPRDWSMGQGTDDNSSKGSTAPSPHVHWFSVNFGPELALGGSALRQADGSWLTIGSWLLRQDTKIELNDLRVETRYKAGTILQESVVMTATTAEGEDIRITGEMVNMCPTKVPSPGGAIFINEGLARYQWGDKTGYGISEQWHLVSAT
jgi:hypothetical protein